MPQAVTTNFEALRANSDLSPVYLFVPAGFLTTQLNGAITAGATTITVDSTTGFPSEGVLIIEDEPLYYSSKGATPFTIPAPLGRGSLATTAASHADDKTVRVAYVFASGPVAGR